MRGGREKERGGKRKRGREREGERERKREGERERENEKNGRAEDLETNKFDLKSNIIIFQFKQILTSLRV